MGKMGKLFFTDKTSLSIIHLLLCDSKLFIFFLINENMLIKKLLLKRYKYISLPKVIRISNYLNIMT